MAKNVSTMLFRAFSIKMEEKNEDVKTLKKANQMNTCLHQKC